VCCVSRPTAVCSITLRVVSTGMASNTAAVVCVPPQDSATRAAAVCRMPTRSPTRLSTCAMGKSSTATKKPTTSALAASDGRNLKRTDIVLSQRQ